MENNITLTNDEIHTIRVEHSEKTKNLSFEEYKRQMDAEIAPALRRLEEIKKQKQQIKTSKIKEELVMSTLEKTIDLLQTIPENELETVYTFLQFIKFQEAKKNTSTENKNRKTSAFGIAHEYANPELIPLENEAFANAMAEKHAIT